MQEWIKSVLEELNKQGSLRDGGRQASKWLVRVMSLYPQIPTMHPIKAFFCAGVLEYFTTRPERVRKMYGIFDGVPRDMNDRLKQMENESRLKQEMLRRKTQNDSTHRT